MSVLQQLKNPFVDLNWKTADQVEIPEILKTRYISGISVLDELFGGKYNPGLEKCAGGMISAVPGGGKTTLFLQYLSALATQGYNVAIFSNEQSVLKLKKMCDRMSIINVPLVYEKDVDNIIKEVNDRNLDVILIDSFNGLTTKMIEKKKREYATVQLLNRVWDYKNYKPFSFFMCVHAQANGKGAKSGGSDLPHALDMVFHIEHGEESKYGVEGVRVISSSKNREAELSNIALQMSGSGYDFSNPLEIVEDQPEEKTDGRSAEKNRRRDLILVHLQTNPQITMEEVIDLCQTNEINAGNDLRALVNEKILVKIGRGKTGFWKKVVAE